MFFAMTFYAALMPDGLGWGTVTLQSSFGLLRFGCETSPRAQSPARRSLSCSVAVCAAAFSSSRCSRRCWWLPSSICGTLTTWWRRGPSSRRPTSSPPRRRSTCCSCSRWCARAPLAALPPCRRARAWASAYVSRACAVPLLAVHHRGGRLGDAPRDHLRLLPRRQEEELHAHVHAPPPAPRRPLALASRLALTGVTPDCAGTWSSSR